MIDFFTKDLSDTSYEIYGENVHFLGKPVNRRIFAWFRLVLHNSN